MAEEQTVSMADVKQVAELANLELTPAEETQMQKDLNSVLAYVAELNELDTTSVAPMAQVSEVVGGVSELRQDTVARSLDRASVMACAPETDGAFFKVPKVIER